MDSPALELRRESQIYAWDEANLSIEFIEVSFKGEKEMEDKSRIRAYLKSLIDSVGGVMSKN